MVETQGSCGGEGQRGVEAGRENPDPNRDERPSCHRAGASYNWTHLAKRTIEIATVAFKDACDQAYVQAGSMICML